MSGFRTPEVTRDQYVLWEHRLEDALPVDHPVRHLDALLRSEPFSATFAQMENAYDLDRGKPPYHPRDLAALYLFGMLHRTRSSRQLEAAGYNRLDVIWLMQGQRPDHSTIAAFVNQHGQALHQLFRDTVEVLGRAGLVPLSHVAIDGSKTEADAGKSSVRGEETIEAWQRHIDEKIAALEAEWKENEKREGSLFGGDNPWTGPASRDSKKALAELKRKQEELNKALAQLKRRQQESAGEPKRIASTTDPDSRSMKDKEGRSKPNYNTQLAVDDAAGVIVAADVNDAPDDSGQLTPMVDQVIDNCGAKPAGVTADSQYNTGRDLAAMEERGIDCYLPDAGKNSEAAAPSAATQQALARVEAGEELSESEWDALPCNHQKKIDKSAFVYDESSDTFRCPNGQTLNFLNSKQDNKKKGGPVERRQYGNAEACAGCPHAEACCKDPKKGRIVSRDQYEERRERLRARMATEEGRDIYQRRKQTVEPRFGHIKRNLGVRRFLRRGMEKVKTEWRLVCTAVNIGILLNHWNEVVKML